VIEVFHSGQGGMSPSGKLVVLKLDGELVNQGFTVTAEITTDGELPSEVVEGALPPCPDLAEALRQWRNLYRTVDSAFRIRPKGIEYIGLLNRRQDCWHWAEQVKSTFLAWLRSDAFRPIDQRLRENWREDESIQVMVRSKDLQVHHLPWHVWDLIDRYSQTAVTFGPTEFKRRSHTAPIPAHPPGKVRILAIMGHSEGINTAIDRQALMQRPDAEVVFLDEPSRQELSEQLWGTPEESDQSPPAWDILFFAGHSQTDNTTGRIYINPDDSLTLEELTYALRKATQRGLQLAIFNSCDGLGLTQSLASLDLPHMIVMREPVPDPIAQRFLQAFLQAFAEGASLTAATRQAREQLQGLESEFPCASWLPVIHHHPGVPFPTWQTLRGTDTTATLAAPKAPAVSQANSHQRPGLFTALLGGLAATLLTMGLRSVNILQPWEFYGYDQMVRSLPTEPPDQRLLVVEVSRADIEALGGEYPLHDQTLLKLLQALGAHNPAVIGIDIYRDRPEGEGQAELQTYLSRRENIVPICAHPHAKDAAGVASPPGINPSQLGFGDVMVDHDGVVRRHLLALDPSSTSPCPAFYGLSAQLALRYLAAQGKPLTFPQADRWQLGETQFRILNQHSGFYPNQAATRGHQILLRYRSYNTLADIAERVSLTQVLAGQVSAAQIQDRVVLIGVTDPTVKDYFRTPHGTELRGLWLHVQMTSQVINAVEDSRSLLRFWPIWGDWLWVYGWAVVGVLIVVPGVGVKPRSLFIALGTGALFVMSWGMFWGLGVVVPLVPSLLAGAIAAGVARARASAWPFVDRREQRPLAKTHQLE
jgi:CHASE2 domain-containing sensor protein